MLSFRQQICSLEDAFKLMERYGLELADWGDGTAAGFAVRLFEFGRVEGSDHLARLAHEYKAWCAEYAAEGKSLDAKLLQDNQGMMEALQDDAELRRDLGSAIRGIKVGPRGGHVWRALAHLATTPRSRLCPDEEILRLAPHIKTAFDKLRPFLYGFDGWQIWMSEEEVADELLASMIRMDIQRLDVTLAEAPPYSGNEPHMSNEIASLLKLVADEGFARVLEARLAWTTDMTLAPDALTH